MAMRTPVSDLPRGHAFAPVAFSLSHHDIDAYLRATGDATAYLDAVPPLAVVALALRALQEQLSLPAGALHTGQEAEQVSEARAGETLTLSGRVAQRSERQGMVISVLEYEVTGEAGGVIVRARTTLMAPAAA
jgi:hypothetical protein